MQDVKQTPSKQPESMGPVSVEEYFRTLSMAVARLPYSGIGAIIDTIVDAWADERTIFVFGNGGSAATASHMVCDLGKGTILGVDQKRLKVMSFTDNVPLLTAWGNDFGYEHIFSEQLKNFVQAGDVALAISASGNSPNVLNALQAGRDAGAITLGLTGHRGGRMKPLCDICVIVPSDNVQVIEDLHHSVAHSIFTVVRQRMYSIACSGFVSQVTGTNG